MTRELSRRKKLAFGTLTIAFILLFGLALCEIVVRFSERRSSVVKRLLDADPVDLASLKFNDTAVTRARPAGEFRILSFGDSFAYSIMSPDFSYAGLIAHDFNATHETPHIRVVNLGEGATTVRDYAAAHAFWSKRVQHDAVLFNIYMGNDLLDVAYQFTKKQWVPNHLYLGDYHFAQDLAANRVPHKYPLRSLDYARALYLSKTGMVRTAPAAPGHSAEQARFNAAAEDNLAEDKFLNVNHVQLVNFDPSRQDTLSEGYQTIAAFFRYVSSLRRSGTKALVVLSPNQVHAEEAFRASLAKHYGEDLSAYDFTLPARTILAIRDAVDPQIEVIDLSPYFVCAGDRGEKLYYLTNTHWGPEGNALAARIITAGMARSWFGRALPPVDPECDPAAYYARFARVDPSRIAAFARRAAQAHRE